MRSIRILMIRLGIDHNDMESKRLYKKLENVGYDILYTGLHQTPEMILDVSLSFDADVVLFDMAPNANPDVIEHYNRIVKSNELVEPLIVLRTDNGAGFPYIKFKKNDEIDVISNKIKKHFQLVNA